MLHQQWLRAVSQHNQDQSETEPFDPITYGTTLGMALLTPSWWLCAGLGDWDLVCINGDEQKLVSEECSDLTPGESTFSLSQSDPLAPMSERFELHGIDEPNNIMSLALCTDGIRKSCRSDKDFLQLCRHLVNLESGSASIQECLTRITDQGSGDDISIAAGTWNLSSD